MLVITLIYRRSISDRLLDAFLVAVFFDQNSGLAVTKGEYISKSVDYTQT